MVNAELVHNPYLLETTARFNGHPPKVNSAIEKFEGHPLVEWVDEVPGTFRNEMNGLDFDLYFTGTDSDYKKVFEAFVNQGIDILDESSTIDAPANRRASSYDVRLIRKGSLESVNAKRREITELLSWLDLHRNRWLDYDEFINGNSETFDGTVSYIIVNENPIQLDMPSVSVETVDSARCDLASTVIMDTPILFMVNPRNRVQFRDELLYVLSRPGIDQRQLFFCIHPSMNQDRVVRVISDLGVENPQVVDRPDSPTITKYLDDFPSTRYVKRCLDIFDAAADEIKAILERVGADSAVVSADRGKEIDELDLEIERLRKGHELIGQVSLFEYLDRVAAFFQQFEDHILSWRNRKTGVTGSEEILKAATGYSNDLRTLVHSLEADVITTMQAEQRRIERSLENLFIAAAPTDSFAPQVECPSFLGLTVAIPDLVGALSSQTGTERVNQKNDFFGLFGSSGKADEGFTTVEVASYDVWRYTARGMLMPAVREFANECKKIVTSYHSSMISAYAEHLETLIEDLLEDRELVTAMLSDAELAFEEDKHWMSEFEKRLAEIERN